MKSLIYLFLAFFLIPNAAISQSSTPVPRTGSIKGNLVNAQQEPVSYATISVFDLQKELILGAISDEKGLFLLEELPLEALRIEIQFLGYKSIQKDIVLSRKNKKVDFATLVLEEDQQQLEEVVVTAEKSQYQLSLDKKVFLVGEDVLSQGGSAIEILDQVPLLSVDPSGAVSLRGSNQVLILINGKRSGLTLNNALDQIPGDNIEKVEVITNPSARYDASGSAGIINIVLKRARGIGWNGQIRAEAGQPANHTLMPGINYKGKKINLFSNMRWRYSDYNGTYSTTQSTIVNNQTNRLQQNEEEDRHDDGISGYFGADFYLNPKNTITAAYFRADTKDSDETTLLYDLEAAGMDKNSITRNGTSVENRSYNQLESNYTHTFDKEGQEFSIDFQYDFWRSNKDWDLLTEGETLLPGIGSQLRTNSKASSQDFVLQSDFVSPLMEKGKLEVGIKGENRIVNNDYLAEVFEQESWMVFNQINNDINYSEKIAAAYVEYSNEFKKLSYGIGLRSEYTLVDIKDDEKLFTGQQEYLNLFPSAHLSLKIKEANTLQLSYSRRINRPSLWSLYPFSEIVDFNLQEIGNPNLTPAYSDGVEMSFLSVQDKFTLNPSVFYTVTQNPFQDFLSQDERGTFLLKPINLDQKERLGFEVSMKYQPIRAISLNGEFSYYHFKETGTYQGQNMNTTGDSWRFRVNGNFSLAKDIKLQSTLDYRGPDNSAQTKILPTYVLTFGVSKNFLEDRLNISLRAFNVLDSREIRTISESPDFKIEQSSKRYGPRYGISFLYKINQTARARMRRENRQNR